MGEEDRAIETAPTQSGLPVDANWLVGGGRMGELIRSMDWSKTPLGPIESWPASLRTTVSLCLASNFPISIAWGQERIQIYNDGYWPVCGDKHPYSMGQDFKECWFSAWPAVGEAFERASAGEATFLENQRMFLDRNGYLEETFFTFSFSPIRDETGAVGGLFHPVTEMTQPTLAERRLEVLRALADRTADAQTMQRAYALITQTVAHHAFDIPFALLYMLDPDGKGARLAGSTGLTPGATACPETVDLRYTFHPTWPLGAALQSKQALQVDDLQDLFGPLECGPYAEPPNTALVLPISLPGSEEPAGLLVAGVSSRRALDDSYRTFFNLLGAAVTNVLTNAQSYEEERRRAEALAELDRAKTLFFSNVSHEFRTPLTLMLGPIEDALADSAHALPEPQRERLDVAHRNSQRLLKLVNSLLDFSRIEAGRVQASYGPTDLPAFTAELASVFRSAIERAGIALVVDCPQLSAPVYVDRDMWEKIVLNLLSNAYKFTYAGEIEVTLCQRDGAAELQVRDTGTGIPEHELPHIFERFHRVEGARGRTYEGTGIGLSLVQELVRLHGGTVAVESAEGQGSTFTVSVPLGKAHLPEDRIHAERTLASPAVESGAYVQEALQWLQGESPSLMGADLGVRPIAQNEPGGGTETRGADTQVRPYTGRAGRVLLVDDNADMRGYVRRVLSQRYEVEAVPDGQAALEAVARRKPDVVLADVMMPRMDGVDLLRALRGGPETRAIPVILLSARAGVESRVGGLNAGADDYLIKPFSARELVARVEIQIARSRLETGLEESEEQYRTLFESIDEGFCVIEMLFDDKDKPIDYRFLRVNPAFKRHTGFENAVGKTVREFVPDHDEHWFTVYGNVARTGEPARFESAAMAMHRWFDVYAFRTGQPESRRVAVLFKDITVQKRAEEERARLLRAIETERERLADVFRQAPSFMCVLGGPDHVFERANELYYQLIGNRDLLGKPMREAVPEAATQGFVELLDEVYQTGEAFAGTAVRLMLQRQPSGPSEERFVDFVFQPLRDPDGSIAGIFVQGVDLTDRSRAEAALRENEERFQALLEHSYDAIVVIDSSGAITYASPSTFRVFGYTPQELLGKSAFDVIHPDDIPAAQAGLGEAAQLSGSAIWIELRIQHKNGSTVWIEVSGHNLLDQPQVHGIVSHFRDITERKVAEDAREAERQRLKTLVDSSPVGVFVIDAATDTILVANNEFDRVMGMTYEEGQAMQWPRFASAFRSSGGNPCAPEDLPFWRALREGAVIQAEEMHVRSQGNTLPVLVNASPVYSSDGRVSAVIGIVQDATPLQEAERQRSEFQAMVTHELRSPLAVIKSVVLVAKDEMSAGDTSEIEELLGSVDAQADRLLNMVNNLLDVSQMEAGAFTVFPQPTELPGVIEEAVATLRRTSQLTVDLRAPDRLPPLHIDRGRVTQVLENLLNNAAKFTQDGKPIAVDIEQSGTGVTVRVRNNGPVIPANQIPLLFKKFSQLQHHAPGAGLGLAICRGIVEAHGGRIWAESSEEIQETAFSFTLPVAVPVTTQQEIDGGPDSADGPAASGRESTSIGREGEVREVKRVLAVDDEPLLLQHLKRFLIKTGYHPILTGDPAEVLSLVEAEKPDLVLLDLRLPGISGFEVFEQIKTISAAPVIFLSANDRSEDKAIALRMGAEDYVTKPFSPVELEARMEAALRRNDGHDT